MADHYQRHLDALRFYQRAAIRLAAPHQGAVDDGRTRLKPEIPAVGNYNIPIRDELELGREIGADA